MVYDTGEGWKGGRWKEIASPEKLVSGYKDGAVLVLATIAPRSLH